MITDVIELISEPDLELEDPFDKSRSGIVFIDDIQGILMFKESFIFTPPNLVSPSPISCTILSEGVPATVGRVWIEGFKIFPISVSFPLYSISFSDEVNFYLRLNLGELTHD